MFSISGLLSDDRGCQARELALAPWESTGWWSAPPVAAGWRRPAPGARPDSVSHTSTTRRSKPRNARRSFPEQTSTKVSGEPIMSLAADRDQNVMCASYGSTKAGVSLQWGTVMANSATWAQLSSDDDWDYRQALVLHEAFDDSRVSPRMEAVLERLRAKGRRSFRQAA